MSTSAIDSSTPRWPRRRAPSTRSLQRALRSQGTSFQREMREARFSAASARLLSTNEKIAAIAASVGLTEGGLANLFRERLGFTAAEYRARARART